MPTRRHPGRPPRPPRPGTKSSSRGRKTTKKPGTGWEKVKAFERDHPNVSLVAMIVFGVVSVVCLFLGFLLENLLYGLSFVMAGFAGAAGSRYSYLAAQRRSRSDYTPKAQRQRQRATRGPATARPTPRNAPTSGLHCNKTGKPLDGEGRCRCAPQHVRTSDGAEAFSRDIGDPIPPSRRRKEPRVPTTNRAKPQPAGSAMRREQ